MVSLQGALKFGPKLAPTVVGAKKQYFQTLFIFKFHADYVALTF